MNLLLYLISPYLSIMVSLLLCNSSHFILVALHQSNSSLFCILATNCFETSFWLPLLWNIFSDPLLICKKWSCAVSPFSTMFIVNFIIIVSCCWILVTPAGCSVQIHMNSLSLRWILIAFKFVSHQSDGICSLGSSSEYASYFGAYLLSHKEWWDIMCSSHINYR